MEPRLESLAKMGGINAGGQLHTHTHTHTPGVASSAGVSGPGGAPPFLHSPLAPFLWVWACLTMRESAGGASSEVRRPVIWDTAMAWFVRRSRLTPQPFFTTIPSSTCTALLPLRVSGNLPLPLVIPSSTHLVVLRETGVRCGGYRCPVSGNLESVWCLLFLWAVLDVSLSLVPRYFWSAFSPFFTMELGLTTFP